jgi:HEAT repeat protein/beta-lactamase regulating signal transducer with metallopeptidase domain
MNPDVFWKLAALGSTVGAAWLLTYAVHSTLLIGGVWLADRARLFRSLRARDLAWRTALAGGLLTATLQLAAGFAPWGGFAELPVPSLPAVSDALQPSPDAVGSDPVPAAPTARGRMTASGTPPTKSSDPSVAMVTRRPPAEPRSGAEIPKVISVRRQAPTLPAPPAAPPAALSAPRLEPASLLFMGWAAVASALLLRLAVVRARVLTALGERTPVVEPMLRARLEGLCLDVGHPRPVALTTAEGLRSPVALGWSEICLPAQALLELDAAQQRSVLAHELAHLRRLDPVWLVLGSVLEQLFFFQPLNRLARARVQEVAEYLCDDWAAARDGSGLSVARGLATVAGWLDGRDASIPLAGMAEHPSQLLTRVQRLLQRGTGEVERLRAWHVVGAITLLLVVILAAPGVRASPERLGLGARKPTPQPLSTDAGAVARTRSSVAVQVPDTTMLDGSPPLPPEPASAPEDSTSEGVPDQKHDPADEPSSRPDSTKRPSKRSLETGSPRQTRTSSAGPSVQRVAVTTSPEVSVTSAEPLALATVAPERLAVSSRSGVTFSSPGVAFSIPAMSPVVVAATAPVPPAPPVAPKPPVAPTPPAPPFGPSAADQARMTRDAERMARDAERRARDAVRRAQARVHGRGHHGKEGAPVDPKTVDALVAALKDADPGVRTAAAESLGRIGDPRAVEPLGSLVSDQNLEVRRAAVEALGQLGDTRAIPALSRAAKDSNPAVRREAAEALLSLEDPAAVEPLLGLLSDADPKVRVMALEGLSRRGDRRALGPLGKLVKDPNVEVRARAVRALARFRDPSAQEALVAVLKDGNPEVRAAAAEALGELELKSAPQGLIDAARDANPDVRQTVAETLGQIRDGKAVSALRSLLDDTNPEVRGAAVEALSEIRDASALQALIAAMQSKDVTVRRAAAQALGQRD